MSLDSSSDNADPSASAATPENATSAAAPSSPGEPSDSALTKKASAVSWALIFSSLALILASFAVLGTYWFYKNNKSQSERMTTLTDGLSTQINLFKQALEVETGTLENVGKTIAEHQRAIDSLPSQTKALIDPSVIAIANEVAEVKLSQSNLELRASQVENQLNAVQNLLADLPSQKVLWQMVEVVQLHRSARKLLIVDHEINSAINALDLSMEILRTINIGDKRVLLQHTEQLSQYLRNLPSSDPNYHQKRLQQLLSVLQQLPLDQRADARQALETWSLPSASKTALPAVTPPPIPWYQSLWRDVFTELAQLVRFTPQTRPLIPPDGEFFFRQNLSLSMLNLRSALLRHDRATLVAECQQLESWVNLYGKESDVQKQALKLLGELQQSLPSLDAKGLDALVSESEYALSRLQQGGRP